MCLGHLWHGEGSEGCEHRGSRVLSSFSIWVIEKQQPAFTERRAVRLRKAAQRSPAHTRCRPLVHHWVKWSLRQMQTPIW